MRKTTPIPKEYENVVAAAKTNLAIYLDLDGQADAVDETVNNWEKNIKSDYVKINEFNRTKYLFSDLHISEDDAPKLQDAVEERLQTRAGFLVFTHIPFELVILGIVIFSGTLGSSVQLVHEFATDTTPRDFSYYMLRYLVGALTSLVLFIVIKAGVLVAVDPRSTSQPATELNAFFVAFIGIVGGLLSDQVLSRLISSASAWFSSGEIEQDRFVIEPLNDVLQDAPSISTLALVSGFSQSDLKIWLAGDQKVPPAAQRAISIWLKKPVREIFTDIPMPPPELDWESSSERSAVGP